MVVYCTVVNMMIEIFLSGMTFEQSLSSRLVAIPVNIIIAVPYGIYRDFAMRQARRISPAVDEKYGRRAGLRHLSVAGVCRYSVGVGADWHQIVAAVSSNGGIDDDGRRLRLLPRLLPPPVPRGAYQQAKA